MTNNEFAEMLALMARAWEKREYEKVAACFNEQLFYSDALHYSFTNRNDLLEFFRDDDCEPQSCEFHQMVFVEETQTGAAEYTYKGTFLYHGTVWIKIENDKISSWREYQHITELDRQKFWKGKS